MVNIILELHSFVLLHYAIIICLGLIDNHRKCFYEILEVIKFVHNLSSMLLVFLNPLQSKFNKYIVVFTIYCPIVFPKNISCTVCMYDFCNRHAIYINCKLFFFSCPTFAEKIVFCITSI